MHDAEDDFTLRPWGESRVKLVLAGLFHVLTLAFLWEPLADVWRIARTVSFTADISDDWQF